MNLKNISEELVFLSNVRNIKHWLNGVNLPEEADFMDDFFDPMVDFNRR